METSGGIDQEDIELLFSCCKSGMSLGQIAQTLNIGEDSVVAALMLRIDITPKKLRAAFNLNQLGKSLEQVSQICGVSVETLAEIFPETKLPIELTSKEGKTDEDVPRYEGDMPQVASKEPDLMSGWMIRRGTLPDGSQLEGEWEHRRRGHGGCWRGGRGRHHWRGHEEGMTGEDWHGRRRHHRH
jgi:hypothetical protein